MNNLNKVIKEVLCEDNKVTIYFKDGGCTTITDIGQNCCEHRYFTFDDDQNDLIGKKLTEIQVNDNEYNSVDDPECDVHESTFVNIVAENVTFSFTAHNEHNGYYSGFEVTIEENNGRRGMAPGG